MRCADLAGCQIANHEFLDAIRALAFTIEGSVRRPIDYKNLGSEELGSVYESLLELHPVLSVDAGAFALETAGGNERKTMQSSADLLYLSRLYNAMPDDEKKSLFYVEIVEEFGYLNLHGEFDFSDQKMLDSVGLAIPKNLVLVKALKLGRSKLTLCQASSASHKISMVV